MQIQSPLVGARVERHLDAAYPATSINSLSQLLFIITIAELRALRHPPQTAMKLRCHDLHQQTTKHYQASRRFVAARKRRSNTSSL